MKRIAGLAFSTSLYLATLSIAAEDWLTRAEFSQAIQRPTSISWEDAAYYDSLQKLSQSSRVAVFLDRRIDPTRSGNPLTVRDRSFLGVVFLSGSEGEIGACTIGDSVYVGPASVTAVLPTALEDFREQIRTLPAESRRIWRRDAPLRCARLTQPRDALQKLADENQLQLVGLDRIPHDLMRSVDLPPMELSDRFAILLTGFDLWPQIDETGYRVELVPFPRPQRWSVDYPTNKPNSLANWVRTSCPQASATSQTQSVRVSASAEDHARIARYLATQPVVVESSAARTVVTLKASASIGAIATRVAEQLQLQFEADSSLLNDLQQRVDVDVSRVTYQELLDKVFENSPLSFELTDTQLRIFRK